MITAVRAAEDSPPPDFAALVDLRHRLSGRPHALTALSTAIDRDPGFAVVLFEDIIPSVLHHAATLTLRDAPALLLAGRSGRVEIPRAKAVALLAHMVLGTMPEPVWPGQTFPRARFDGMLDRSEAQVVAKLRCVLALFECLGDRSPPGVLRIERDLPPVTRTALEWAMDGSPLTAFEVKAKGGIEDAHGCLQVDFANRFLGGGVLRTGAVQEEIRFSVCPELLVGLLLCAAMRDDEALRLRGAERFAAVEGYARTLRYVGPCNDECPRDPDGTPAVELVAIDALDLRRFPEASAQFRPAVLLREMEKARIGFGGARARTAPTTVATGHWGCGVFGAHPQLKAVLQWLAASACGAGVRWGWLARRPCGL